MKITITNKKNPKKLFLKKKVYDLKQTLITNKFFLLL